MYFIFSKFESLLSFFYNIIIKLYFKLKYGKKLIIGKKVKFRFGIRIVIDKNGTVKIGDNCFFNRYCTIDCNKEIIIGKHNLFGENVKIYDHNHQFDDKNIDRGVNYKNYRIKIGNENWFGTGITILGDTIIENYNVFAANIVVKGNFKSEEIIQSENSKKYKIDKIKFIRKEEKC
ncbi:putative lipopolysaccharide biosynthesis O-acetyl transferase WbbJ [Turicibacter sanguinis]|nr:putative lipopolysaccharide biosynthesis O-acetyl transferase WbbJ [Turicibacter sanguinis]